MDRGWEAPADCTIGPEFREHFWAHVDVRGEDECWPWTLSSWEGYGRCAARIPTEEYTRQHGTHRLALLLTCGLEPWEQVLHHCDNPPCCNPNHLYTGDPAANAQDRRRRGRSMRGSAHYVAKLTENDVRAIRMDRTVGGLSHSQLAKKYGVSMSNIRNIVMGRTWAHLLDGDHWVADHERRERA